MYFIAIRDIGHRMCADIGRPARQYWGIGGALARKGGGVELLCHRRAEGAWEFRRVMNDSSWAMLEEETDAEPPVSVPTWVASWDEAVGLLDLNPWAQLWP